MLSASFYGQDGEEVGYLTLVRDPFTLSEAEGRYRVEWVDVEEANDVQTEIKHRHVDGVRDLFAMALVEVDAILAERAVN